MLSALTPARFQPVTGARQSIVYRPAGINHPAADQLHFNGRARNQSSAETILRELETRIAKGEATEWAEKSVLNRYGDTLVGDEFSFRLDSTIYIIRNLARGSKDLQDGMKAGSYLIVKGLKNEKAYPIPAKDFQQIQGLYKQIGKPWMASEAIHRIISNTDKLSQFTPSLSAQGNHLFFKMGNRKYWLYKKEPEEQSASQPQYHIVEQQPPYSDQEFNQFHMERKLMDKKLIVQTQLKIDRLKQEHAQKTKTTQALGSQLGIKDIMAPRTEVELLLMKALMDPETFKWVENRTLSKFLDPDTILRLEGEMALLRILSTETGKNLLTELLRNLKTVKGLKDNLQAQEEFLARIRKEADEETRDTLKEKIQPRTSEFLITSEQYHNVLTTIQPTADNELRKFGIGPGFNPRPVLKMMAQALIDNSEGNKVRHHQYPVFDAEPGIPETYDEMRFVYKPAGGVPVIVELTRKYDATGKPLYQMNTKAKGNDSGWQLYRPEDTELVELMIELAQLNAIRDQMKTLTGPSSIDKSEAEDMEANRQVLQWQLKKNIGN